MGRSPSIKCYDAAGKYQASVKDYDLAGAIMAMLGEGSTVRDGHTVSDIVYTEGVDGDCGESYDAVNHHVFQG